MRVLLVLPFLALSLIAAPEPVVVPGLFDIQNQNDPVDGKKIGKPTTDWKGVRIHFSDAKNIVTFKKAPNKYVEKLGLKLVEIKDKEGKVVRTVLDVQNKKCVVNPESEARAEQFFEKNGLRVHTCCAKCKGYAKKHWAETAKALGYVWVPPVIDLRNSNCPVTGDHVYPSAPIWTDIDGIRIRLCCDHCVEEIAGNEERVFEALGVDPKKLKAKLLARKKS